MRKVLKSSNEVFHYFANKVQSEGRTSNAFFENGILYSYGRHFAMARHLDNGVVAFTTRTYSNTTAKHLSKARSACNHLKIVYCDDPAKSAAQNMQAAQLKIVQCLNAAEAPRIRQATRDAHKARALSVAENANEYLHALSPEERGSVTRFDTTALEYIRVVMQEQGKRDAQLREDAAKARALEAADRLNAWRNRDGDIRTSGFNGLPVALRLGYREQWKGEAGYQIIETSHGAEIPVSVAPALWAGINQVMTRGCDKTNINSPCGHYTLNTIRADGSIVVGCHDIPYAEIRRIAELLGYVQAEETAGA